MTRRGCGYGYAYGGSYACSYCNHTLYPQAAGEFCGHFNKVASRFLQIPAATGYLLMCFFVCFVFPSVRWAPPCRVHEHDYVGASGRPPSVRPVPRSRACQFRTHQRKETTQRSAAEYRRPAFTFGSFPADARVHASSVPDPARPDPPRQAATAHGAPRVPATETRQPSPISGSLRRSSHFGSRSAPSRAALLAWLMAASWWAFPLDRALCGRPAAVTPSHGQEFTITCRRVKRMRTLIRRSSACPASVRPHWTTSFMSSRSL